MALHKCPACPNCESRLNSVVLVRRLEEGEHLRRRVCETCEHRWYSLQAQEQVVSSHLIRWQGKQPVLDREPVPVPPTIAAKALDAFWGEEHNEESLSSEQRMRSAFQVVVDHIIPPSVVS
jgi:hypothetical protein